MELFEPVLPVIQGVQFYCNRVSQDLPVLTGDNNPNHEKVIQQQNAKAKLIQKAFGKVLSVDTYPEGKPKPLEGKHISFSHSREYIILAVSASNVGIDLQFYTEKLIRVSGKFISDNERMMLSSEKAESDKQTHFLWCAKEAVFKLYGTEVPFKDIIADHLNLDQQGCISFTVKEHAKHIVYYSFFEDFCFCIAL